jgi:nitric-oxide synthase
MRDFLEDWRYDKTEDIAKVLKLDTSSEQTLWRDRVALELNVAILYSFQKAKVSMVDHQTASKQFLAHDLREKKAGRECPGDAGWIVPPAGGTTCPVWHHQMRDFYLDPAYHSQTKTSPLLHFLLSSASSPTHSNYSWGAASEDGCR